MTQTKTLKQLKAELSNIIAKGYNITEKSSSTSEYDIKYIIENNINNQRTQSIKKHNILKLDINENIFDIHKEVEYNLKDKYPQLTEEEIKTDFKKSTYTERVLKDFAEIDQEIKQYFDQFKPTDKADEIIKNLSLGTHFFKNVKYGNIKDQYNLKEIETTYKKGNEKNLILSHNFLSYTSYYSYKFDEYFNKINELLKIYFDIESEPIQLKDLSCDADLKEFENNLNEVLNHYQITLYKNGKIIINFKNQEHHKKVFETLLNKTMVHYKDIIYINVDEIPQHPKNQEIGLYKNTKNNNIYLKYEVDLYKLQLMEGVYKDILRTPKGKYYHDDLEHINTFYAGDKERKGIIYADLEPKVLYYLEHQAKDYFKTEE